MELQLPMALQVSLYVASAAIVLLVAVLTVVALQLRGKIERVVRAVEEIKAEVNPLVQDTRVVMETIRDLSGRVHGQWMEVEQIIDTARTWSQRVSHLMERIGSIVETPIFAASNKIHILRRGLETFVRVLANGTQHYQPR